MSERTKVSGADLRRLRDRLDCDDAFGWRPQILALLNHIDFVEAERSAAPEMLAALKWVRTMFRTDDERDMVRAIDEAIAKAEGRS